MIRAKIIFFIINLLMVSTILISCGDKGTKIYFDVNWNKTTKENAAFFRTPPKEENGIWHIRDYYITGEKQFVGQAKDSLVTILEGDVIWYFKTGKVQNRVRYKDGEVVAKFTVVEGAKGSVEEGWDEKDVYYYDQLANVEDAQESNQNSRVDVYEYFYTNTSVVASRHNVGYDGENSLTLFFNKLDDIIGRLDYNEKSEKWKGKEVIFYEAEKEGKNEMNSIEKINTYDKGAIVYTEYYNENEVVVASGSFKNEAPFTGTFYKETCRLKKIKHYEEGSLLKEVTFDQSNEKLGELSFQDEKPNTGVFYKCESSASYKDGALNGPVIEYPFYGSGKEDVKFNYKNNLKHGEYFIYENAEEILEKGSYENDVLTGEVWYYHNGGFSDDESDLEEYYYLKTTVQSVNNKPFISELSQFNLEDNKLLKTFEFEKNTTDEFTYLNHGYHSLYLKDLNSDGFDDIQIVYSHQFLDDVLVTYYMFNSATSKYQHIAELDDVHDIEIDAVAKTILATYGESFGEEFTHVTYGFLKNKLIKKLEIEDVYHSEKDTLLTTQIFPLPIDDFPLLDTSLPPITFVQQGKEHHITDTHQILSLEKSPFSVVLPGLINAAYPKDFSVKVTASYDKNIFKKATVNQREEDTSIFGPVTAFAMGADNPFFVIDENGHNIYYYDDTEYATLDYKKNINEDVLLLQFNVGRIGDEGENKVISEINKPIYMIIYTDKNENKKIDNNEIFYVSIDI